MGMIETAQRLIGRFGQPATLRKPGAKTGPEWNPTTGEPTDHAVVIALTEYSIEERGSAGLAETDLRAFFDATIEPNAADTLLVAGRTFSVKKVGRIYQGADVVCYDVQVSA
ncbi:hypothetical protein VK792_07845 [Mesobacterium sp. TK19101]|uniref:Phage protein n=1 Tax=Mesobacterium hydrothermale TaxID=3111907 RepID=A0ABU6HGF0_9RHOB|nr:hypothetical protein [Mesobacterium sp. TK19101]MEC3861192.1 hypothetical protein [Mesobacterium sp. TK19101]